MVMMMSCRVNKRECVLEKFQCCELMMKKHYVNIYFVGKIIQEKYPVSPDHLPKVVMLLVSCFTQVHFKYLGFK